MKELNKNTLKRAIENLPQYQPPEEVWESIEQELFITTALPHLPQHTPFETTWEKIADTLDGDRKAKVVSFINWRNAAAAAAITGLFLFGAIWLVQSKQTVEIAYSTEVIEERNFQNDWDEEEQTFETVKGLAAHYAFENPEMETLKVELSELDEAKKEVKTMMKDYGANVRFVKQLSEIERERSDVLKKIAAFI